MVVRLQDVCRGLARRRTGGSPIVFLALLVLATIPGIVLAQQGDGGAVVTVITGLTSMAMGWIKGIAVGVGALLIMWGLLQTLIQGANNPNARSQGIQLVISGAILVLLIFAVEGVVNFMRQVGQDVNTQLSK